MRELLITYLGVTVSIALLMTGPDEDEFAIKHIMATVFGWPLLALALAWMAWPILREEAKHQLSRQTVPAMAQPPSD
jgi:uncharacterized membrane protein YccC